MQFLQLRPIAILAAFILIYLINAQGEDIDRDFHVASGEEPGSCDKTKRDFAPKGLDLNSFYREAFEMAGYTANRMIEYGSDQVVRATLLTFFGIREDPTTNPVSVMRADIGLYEAIAGDLLSLALLTLHITKCVPYSYSCSRHVCGNMAFPQCSGWTKRRHSAFL